MTDKRPTIPATDRVLLSMRAAGELLSVSEPTVRRLIADGRLRSVRLGWRVLVPRQAVDDLAAELVRESEEQDERYRLNLRRVAR